ncbi:MAG: hypothetical protein AB7S26_12665 [Sandaracinaceae bacterium]
MLVIVSALACDPVPAPALMYSEDFESVCDGAPCGWSQRTGEPSQATYVETFHPGEHGLRLSGSVSVRGPEAPEDALRLRGSSVTFEAATRCDLGSFLTATVVIRTDAGEMFDASALVTSEPEWGRSGVRLDFIDTIVGGHVASVILDKEGGGVCEVSDMTVDIALVCEDACC